MTILIGLFAVLFTFGVAIFVHEFGHFLFAKLFGVRVETFSIGFGRKIASFRHGETEYQIAIIPFGGYVKMAGFQSKEIEEMIAAEEAEAEKKAKQGGNSAAPPVAADADARPAPASSPDGPAAAPPAPDAKPSGRMTSAVLDDMHALRSKPYPQKILIFAAGCIFNLLTAVFILFMFGWVGSYRSDQPAIVQSVTPAEAAPQVPLYPGDVITGVGERPVARIGDFIDEYTRAAETAEGSPVTILVLREETTVPVALPAALPPLTLEPGQRIAAIDGVSTPRTKSLVQTATRAVGSTETASVTLTIEAADGSDARSIEAPRYAAAGPFWPLVLLQFEMPPYIDGVTPNLPAERAGLRSGDMILSIDGREPRTSADAVEIIRSSIGRTVPFVVERKAGGGETVRAEVLVPVRPDPDVPARGQIGIAFGLPLTRFERAPFGEALATAFIRTGELCVMYLEAVGDLLANRSFQTIRESVGGPVAIATITYKAANEGLTRYLMLFAFFNIVLAVTNLLPIPVLDGGHIVFATVEAIIRRPIPAWILIPIYNIFIFLIIGLALLLTFNDLIMNAWRFPGLG